jgi:hypothetical protein
VKFRPKSTQLGKKFVQICEREVALQSEFRTMTNPAPVRRRVLIRKTQPEEPVEERHAPALERQLLKSSVLTMAAGRSSCSSCGRSPLIGERIQVFAVRDGRERALCDLCAAGEGEPLRKERVWPATRTPAVQRAA